mgnify:FL=1
MRVHQGGELPIASRNLGRNIGMGYNYFKVLVKVLSPKDHKPAEIVDIIRKGNQQVVLLCMHHFQFFASLRPTLSLESLL